MLRPGEPICPEGYPSPNTILALSVLFHNQYLTEYAYPKQHHDIFKFCIIIFYYHNYTSISFNVKT